MEREHAIVANAAEKLVYSYNTLYEYNTLMIKVPVACAKLDIVVEYYYILPITHVVTITCWKRAVSILVILCAWQLSRWHHIILLILRIPMELLIKCWSETCEKSFSLGNAVRQHMEVRLHVAHVFPMKSNSLRDYPKPWSIWVTGVWPVMKICWEYIWPASFLQKEWRLTHFLSESTISRITQSWKYVQLIFSENRSGVNVGPSEEAYVWAKLNAFQRSSVTNDRSCAHVALNIFQSRKEFQQARGKTFTSKYSSCNKLHI